MTAETQRDDLEGLSPGSLVGIVLETPGSPTVLTGTIRTIQHRSHVILELAQGSGRKAWCWPTRVPWRRIIDWKLYDHDTGTPDEFVQDMSELAASLQRDTAGILTWPNHNGSALVKDGTTG